MKEIENTDEVLMKFFRIFWTSIRLSRKAWIALFLGWLAFVVSFVLGFKVPSSGALMLGAVVLSEFLHSSEVWVGFWKKNPNSIVKKVDSNSDPNINSFNFVINEFSAASNITARGSKWVPDNTQLFKALDLMDNSELLGKYGGNFITEKIWALDQEAGKYDRFLHISNSITAILGSVLWGYGDLIWCSC